MPDQISNVQISIVPAEPNEEPTQCIIQVGPSGYQRDISYLFDRMTDEPEHLIGNIRLKRIIGGYTSSALWSSEFLDLLNDSGIKTNTGTYYITDISLNQDGSYTVAFGPSKVGPASTTVTVALADLQDDTHDVDMVLRNVRSFLRLEGYNDLVTPAANGLNQGNTAIQAVAAATFRY